jgi:hypothetical protein
MIFVSDAEKKSESVGFSILFLFIAFAFVFFFFLDEDYQGFNYKKNESPFEQGNAVKKEDD